ncbi:MAG: HD domain-containing phosphohydrolase [Dehalococcoidia bacterium]|nr:HD domain-containing phosphohydrolase [Dehalococcoidia bacterium]
MGETGVLDTLDRLTARVFTSAEPGRTARMAAVGGAFLAVVALQLAHMLGFAPVADEAWAAASMLAAALPIALAAAYLGWKAAAIPGLTLALLHLMEYLYTDMGVEHLIHAIAILFVGFLMSWAVAHQRSRFLETHRLLDETTRLNTQLDAQRKTAEARAQRLEALRTITQAIASNTEVSDAMRAALESTAKALGMDGGFIYRFSPETQTLLLMHFYGVSPEALARIRTIALGEGLVGHVAATREPYSIENVDTHTGQVKPLQNTPLATGVRAISRLSIPLVTASAELLGVVTLLSARPHPFASEDMSFLEMVGSEIASAIEHAGLLETATREARQAEALSRANRETEEQVDASLANWALEYGHDRVEARFPFLAGSTKRIQTLADRLAGDLFLSEVHRNALALAVNSRDAGLLAIPDGIISKTGPLTAEECVQMQKHPQLSLRFLACLHLLRNPAPSDVLPLIAHHHERWDGTGYPDGLRGEQIPLGARIIAVTEAYEALTHDRPYRRCYSHQEALAILHEGAGSQWDPAVVKALIDSFGA